MSQPPQVVDQIVSLAVQGFTRTGIAAHLNISKGTVNGILHRRGIQPRRCDSTAPPRALTAKRQRVADSLAANAPRLALSRDQITIAHVPLLTDRCVLPVNTGWDWLESRGWLIFSFAFRGPG
jgi:hypothetical protein